MLFFALFLIVAFNRSSVIASHFRGGAISWRPAMNVTSVLSSQRSIIIDQRYVWSKGNAAGACTTAKILTFGPLGDSSDHLVKCLSSLATCTTANYPSNVTTYVPCTDFNNPLGMSYGYGSTTVNLTVLSSGLVVGYASIGAWLSLELSGSGGWSLIAYINMKPRADNALINSSPISDVPVVIYVPADGSITTSIDIPVSDVDGDDIQCRFSLSSNTLAGVSVDECGEACGAQALPVSSLLISDNNTCILNVSLPDIGYYAVAIQLEDFLPGTSTRLSSVPVQFLLLAYDTSNPSSACTQSPVINGIPPDLPSPGDTVAIQVMVLYTAMVIAQTSCVNDTDTMITNFITSSPPGMLKTSLPFALTPPQYAINLTWTPTIDQLGKTYTFCAVAVDSNYYSSSQFCFYLFVGPKTTTTTTTSTTTTSSTSTTTTSSRTTSTSTTSKTTSTSSTSATTTSTTSATTSTTSTTTTTAATTTTVTQYNYIPLVTGLSLGLGLPLLLLASLLALFYLSRWLPGPLRSIIQNRFGCHSDRDCSRIRETKSFDDPANQNRLKSPDSTHLYREQYINTHGQNSTSERIGSSTQQEFDRFNGSSVWDFSSPSEFILSTTANTTQPSHSSTAPIPLQVISRETAESLPPFRPLKRKQSSVLVRAYAQQIHPM